MANPLPPTWREVTRATLSSTFEIVAFTRAASDPNKAELLYGLKQQGEDNPTLLSQDDVKILLRMREQAP